MKSVGLISCGKNKLEYSAEAKDLYIGDLFKKARAYAEKVHDEWLILSALHQIVSPEQMLEPYNLTLNDASKEELISWSKDVFDTIKSKYKNDTKIYIYAGSNYRKHLQPLLEQHGYDVTVPMQGLGIGQQKAWLKKQLGV